MTLNWGGKREGAGRKSNGLPETKPRLRRDKTTAQKIVAAAKADPSGKSCTPLEFLVKVMQDETQSWPVRIECAKAAVGYTAARLQSVDIKSEEDKRLVIEIIDFRKTMTTIDAATNACAAGAYINADGVDALVDGVVTHTTLNAIQDATES